MTETIEVRDMKIKNWIINTFWKNKTNLLLLMIILIAITVRVFFFIQTTSAGQTMWWDEASYMAQAVHYAYGTPYDVQSMIQRPPGFQYIAAIGMGMGLSENMIIFLLSLVPSVILIALVFILGRSMFNKRVGLIASAFLSVAWNFIFWSNRAQPDFLSICCQVLAIYYFWEMLKKKSEDSNMSVTSIAILAGFWSAAGFYFKISSLLIPLSFLIYITIKDKLKIFTKKEYWIYGISYIITLIPYFVWAYSTFNDIFAFREGYSNSIIGHMPFAWSVLVFFQIFGLMVLFLIFLCGAILCLRALLYLDIIIKKNDLDVRIFLLSIIITTLCFYIFYIRAIEDRWVFILLPMMALLAGMALDKLYEWAAEHENWKWVAIIFIIAILAYSSYEQFNYAKATIGSKIGTYKDVRLAAEWMKTNSQPNEIIMSISYPQTVFYSQRHVETYSNMNQSDFEAYINKAHPTYITVSIYEPGHPSWIFSWVQNTSRVIPVQGYFQDIQQTKPALVIYRFTY